MHVTLNNLFKTLPLWNYWFFCEARIAFKSFHFPNLVSKLLKTIFTLNTPFSEEACHLQTYTYIFKEFQIKRSLFLRSAKSVKSKSSIVHVLFDNLRKEFPVLQRLFKRYATLKNPFKNFLLRNFPVTQKFSPES